MIKNIIFDLGNVIVNNPTIDTVKSFFKDDKDAETFNNYIFQSKYWKMMDLGEIENAEIANRIEANKEVDVSNYNEIREFMLHWFTACGVNEKTMKIGKLLKEKGYHIYILSNMAKATFQYFSSTYEFFNVVDGAIVSAHVGVKKPDRKIFDILIEKYSLIPEECLLIDDDDTNRTIEMANSMGIKGRRVLSNNPEDVTKLLHENGIDI